MDSHKVTEAAYKHALKNAFDYGTANPNAVVGKVIAEAPEAKADMRGAMEIIRHQVEIANKLSKEVLARELHKFEFAQKKEEPHKLRLQDAVEGAVVTRFPPEPNGFLHIGHAKAAWLNRKAADDWAGKCLLRLDDTNPEAEDPEFLSAIKADLQWLGVNFHGESYASDLMELLYGYCRELILSGNAYACSCGREEIKEGREKMEGCACRNKSAQESEEIFNSMVEGNVKEGQSIIRFRGDMKSLNTVMRDPALFRIIDAPHYRQGSKYKAWPSYDFEACIADSVTGVTHALRSKEYELRDELYFAILERLGLRKPAVYGFSRLNIKGTLLSKRFLKPLILEEKVMGWDDPRLPTIAGLRRRGILPEAIREFVLSFGLSKVESEPDWDALLSFNRKLLDSRAGHYYFVANPAKLSIGGIGELEGKKIDVPVLSSNPPMGVRTHTLTKTVFIDGSDAAELNAGDVFRLKDAFNVRIIGKNAAGIEGEFAGTELQDGRKIQWVGAEKGEAIPCTLLKALELVDENGGFNPDSLRVVKGFCEKACASLNVGDIVQFERVGFCRLDRKDADGQLEFVWSC